jgi:two-component system NtrC family sensor kinase
MTQEIEETATDLRQKIAALEIQLAGCRAELSEAREQQTAASEILSVISRVPTRIQPAFEAIVARAARMCEAEFSAVARFDDGLLYLVAVRRVYPRSVIAGRPQDHDRADRP